MKNIITWKDADQNLCTLAAVILDSAMTQIRGHDTFLTPVPTTNGQLIPPGWLEDGDSGRSIFSGQTHRIMSWGTPSAPDADLSTEITPLCWWSFQNLVRQRLLMAREDLRQNRYKQTRDARMSDQRSRNKHKRSKRSKFGRQPER